MARGYWIYEDDYKHYRNFAAGCTVFVTATTLDFVPVFACPAAADLMTASILSDSALCEARVWAFAVMPTHIHVLAGLKESQTASAFMSGVKSKAAKRIGRLIGGNPALHSTAQIGLGRRSFWQRSFRSVAVVDREAFAVKVDYIHMNPVKAGLCREPAEYRWSSAWLLEAGLGSWDCGIVVSKELLREFADESALRLGHGAEE